MTSVSWVMIALFLYGLVAIHFHSRKYHLAFTAGEFEVKEGRLERLHRFACIAIQAASYFAVLVLITQRPGGLELFAVVLGAVGLVLSMSAYWTTVVQLAQRRNQRKRDLDMQRLQRFSKALPQDLWPDEFRFGGLTIRPGKKQK